MKMSSAGSRFACRKRNFIGILFSFALAGSLCGPAGCGKEEAAANFSDSVTYEDISEDPSLIKGSRDNSVHVLTPLVGDSDVRSCEVASVDLSYTTEGYFSANYFGECSKVKLQVTGPDRVTYTYNLTGGDEFFPLSAGDGTYSFGVYENITDTQYAVALSEEKDVVIENEFGPNLYPNQYCMFDENTKYVKKSMDLAYTASDDLGVITNVFNYCMKTLDYDTQKATDVASGYVCNLDETYETHLGICLDYAAVMTCMLRVQGIPAKLDVGYAGAAYHAWISTYIKEKGWVNGIIEFDGVNWSLMDPTFSDNNSADTLKNFIGDGSNYMLKYVY